MLTRTIDTQTIHLDSLSAVREQLDLPDDFGIRTFIDVPIPPQRFWGEDRILDDLTTKLEAAVPQIYDPTTLPELVDRLTAIFRADLVELGNRYDLPLEDIDAAAEDFRDLLMPGIYALIQRRYAKVDDPFDMHSIVATFLNDTTYYDMQTAVYPLTDGRELNIKLIYDHFGPFGIMVQTGDAIAYAADFTHHAPSAHHLPQLATSIGNRISDQIV